MKRGLDPGERASPDELASLQFDRLKSVLRLARARVPHYQERFAAAQVDPADLRTLADLSRFPFTEKGISAATIPTG